MEVYFRSTDEFGLDYIRKFSVDGTAFYSVYQYVVYRKALYYSSPRIAAMVLKERGTEQLRLLDKKIAPFYDNHWKSIRTNYLIQGNICKFRCNMDLRKKLVKYLEGSVFYYEDADIELGTGKRNIGGNILGGIFSSLRNCVFSEEVV